MGKILDIFLSISRMVEAIMAKVLASRLQADREILHDCPADWFGDHFSGLRESDIENETSETESSDRSEG